MIFQTLLMGFFLFFLTGTALSKGIDIDDPLSLREGKALKANKITDEEKKIAAETLKVFDLLGDGKDSEKTQGTIAKINEIIETHPDYPDVYFMRAMIYYYFTDNQDYEKMISDIDKATLLHSKNEDKSSYKTLATYLSLEAKVYKDKKDWQNAIRVLERAVNEDYHEAISANGVDPDEPDNTKEWTKKDFDQMIRLFPKDYRGYLFRGILYDVSSFVSKTYDLAIKDYKQAVILNPKSAFSYLQLGKVYHFRLFFGRTSVEDFIKKDKATLSGKSIFAAFPDDYKNMVEAFTKAIQISPSMIDAYRSRADVYLTAKKYPLAIQDYNHILKLDPEDGGAYNDRGLAYENLGDHREAINDFDNAINAKNAVSRPSFAYYERGNSNVKLGNYEEAIRDFSKAIEFYFDLGLLNTNISKIKDLYPEYDDLTDEQLIEKLHAKYFPQIKIEDFSNRLLNNDNKISNFSSFMVDFYKNSGDAYLKSGDYNRAVREYDRAFKINSDPAYATASIERWQVINACSSDCQSYLDIKNVGHQTIGQTSFWIRDIYKKPKKKISQTIFQWEVSCSANKIRANQIVNYDSKGTVIDSFEGEGDWKEIVPESIGEALYNGWCK